MDVVIDADVMRSASEKEHPVSSGSREVLELIRERGHRVVHSKRILAEHKKHESKFASAWRVSMVARRQWCKLDDDLEDRRLRKCICDGLGASESDERAAFKDAHLLEAAIVCDQRIISRDATARALFQMLCPNLGRYREIFWADMTGRNDESLAWIARDLPDDAAMRLC